MLLLTGVTGFVGNELLKKLKNLQHEKFRCLVRNLSSASLVKAYNGAAVIGDITDRPSVRKAVKGADTVIHAAAVIKAKDPRDYLDVNVAGTKNLVDEAKRAGVKHFIFMSSILAAYAKTTPYGRSKLAAEEVVRRSGLPYTILRISSIYKKNDDKAIGSLLSFIKKSPIIPLIGFGSITLQPVHIDDVALAVLAASRKRPKNATYYIVGPAITYRELLKAMTEGLRVRRMFLPVPAALLKWLLLASSFILPQKSLSTAQVDFLTANKVFSYEEARRDLGFSPLPFQQGLKKIL